MMLLLILPLLLTITQAQFNFEDEIAGFSDFFQFNRLPKNIQSTDTKAELPNSIHDVISQETEDTPENKPTNIQDTISPKPDLDPGQQYNPKSFYNEDQPFTVFAKIPSQSQAVKTANISKNIAKVATVSPIPEDLGNEWFGPEVNVTDKTKESDDDIKKRSSSGHGGYGGDAGDYGGSDGGYSGGHSGSYGGGQVNEGYGGGSDYGGHSTHSDGYSEGYAEGGLVSYGGQEQQVVVSNSCFSPPDPPCDHGPGTTQVPRSLRPRLPQLLV